MRLLVLPVSDNAHINECRSLWGTRIDAEPYRLFLQYPQLWSVVLGAAHSALEELRVLDGHGLLPI